MGRFHVYFSGAENCFFYPKKNRSFILERCEEILYSRFKYLVPVLLLMALYFIVVDLFFLRGSPESFAYRYYFVVDVLFLLLQTVCYAAFIVRGGVSSRGNRRLSRRVVFIFTLTALVWSALISSVEIRQTGNFTTLIIAIMTMSAFGLFSLPVFLFLLCFPLALFIGTVVLLPYGSPGLDGENLMFLFSLSLIAFAVSRSFFASTLGAIQKTHELETLNRDLRHLQRNMIRKEKLAVIGGFAAGIAHEINNPLGFVKSNVSALEQGFSRLAAKHPELAGDESFGPFLKRLDALFSETKEGFRRISEIIDNLKIFAREIPEGRYEPYDLNRGIESTVIIARNELKSGIRLVKRFGGVPPIEARGGEINQVILNLLLNAVYAVKNGSGKHGTISITTWSDESSAYCDVSDSGPGVDPSVRDSIFDPFFTTKPLGEGMGLGLSLSYEIVVNRHRGSIELLEGSPTTFRLTLPLRRKT